MQKRTKKKLSGNGVGDKLKIIKNLASASKN